MVVWRKMPCEMESLKWLSARYAVKLKEEEEEGKGVLILVECV